MKIKESVRKLLDNNRGHALVMDALDCSFSAARVYIKDNKRELTTAAVMEAIRKKFGLTDLQILEKEEEPVKG